MAYPDSIGSLIKIEKIKIKNIQKDEVKKCYCIVADDEREYIMFSSTKTANEYATSLMAELEDDPQILFELRLIGKSKFEYAQEKINEKGAQYVLSYDQHHKTFLPNNVVAYRIA